MSISQEFNKRTRGFLIGGLSFVAALSWNNTIRDAIDRAIPLPENKLYANFIYSMIVTILLVIAISYISENFTQPIEFMKITPTSGFL